MKINNNYGSITSSGRENVFLELEGFEKYIDKKLMESKSPKGSSIYIKTPNEFTVDHYKYIKNKYIEAGWKDVKFDFGGQIESWNYLTFEY